LTATKVDYVLYNNVGAIAFFKKEIRKDNKNKKKGHKFVFSKGQRLSWYSNLRKTL